MASNCTPWKPPQTSEVRAVKTDKLRRRKYLYGSCGVLIISTLVWLVMGSEPAEGLDPQPAKPTLPAHPQKVNQAKITYHSPLDSWDSAQGSESNNSQVPLEEEVHQQPIAKASITPDEPYSQSLDFGQVLQELQSPGFTPKAAKAVRQAMKEAGADRDQFKLFDRTWAANQPEAAVAYLDEIDPEDRSAYLRNMIPGLASESPQNAIELFESMDPKVQAKIRRPFLEGLIDNDVVVATDYIYESTDPKNYNWRPMDELARELVVDQGLEFTLQWADGLPKGPLRSSAWSAAYAVWESKDAHAALQSIMNLPKGQDRNLAINGLVSAHAHKDGERAVQWAAEITNPGLRNAAMIRVGRQYYRQNPLAATEWFDKSNLPQSAWDQLISSQ